MVERRKIILKSIIGYVIVLLALSACASEIGVQRSSEGVLERERLCYRFIFRQMTSQNSGITTNYLNPIYQVAWATGDEVLSESQGLGIQYFLRIKDEESYNRLLSFIKEYINQPQGLSYRYTPNREYAWSMNAVIDDLRIIDALIDGADVFGKNSYRRLAHKWSKRLYETNVIEDKLYDFYDWELEKCNEFITLCYIDVATLDKMSEYDVRWSDVREQMLPILEGSYIGDSFPMFQTRYRYDTHQYEVGESINMVEATLTALHLAQIDRCPEETINFLKQRVAQGNLYTHYSLDGEAVTDIQSTALYAICAILAGVLEDEVFYEQSIEQMNRWQVLNPESEIYGAFGNEVTLEVYAFDNLMALMAYRAR